MNYEVNEFDFVKSLLVPGENILWKGKPEKGAVFTKQDVIMIPFSIFWCGFAFFWFFSALEAGIFALFGVPFVLVGIYLVFGRFFVTAYLRKNTFYIITNKKIIRKKGKRVDMMDIANLPPMHIEMYKDGRGTISFGASVYTYNRGRQYEGPMFSLENIANAVQIENLIASIKD